MTDSAIRQAVARAQDFQSCSMPLSPRELPGRREVHLWHLNLTLLAASLRGALGGEHNDESMTPAQLSFVRRFYLRLLLGSYLGLAGKDVHINRSGKGKPSIDCSAHDSALQFSMAKSGDRLLIGIASRDHMGVDLEPLNRRAHNALGVARRYFSQSEADALAMLSGNRLHAAFLRAWALKEAVVKANGMGIANQLCRFTVETDLDRPPAILDFPGEDLDHWSVELLEPEQGYVGAVALGSSGIILKTFRLLPAPH